MHARRRIAGVQNWTVLDPCDGAGYGLESGMALAIRVSGPGRS